MSESDPILYPGAGLIKFIELQVSILPSTKTIS